MTHGESLARAIDFRAMGRTVVATYGPRHVATAHAQRIGGEVLPGPMGFDVFAPETALAPERHEAMHLFTPAPNQLPGQLNF